MKDLLIIFVILWGSLAVISTAVLIIQSIEDKAESTYTLTTCNKAEARQFQRDCVGLMKNTGTKDLYILECTEGAIE